MSDFSSHSSYGPNLRLVIVAALAGVTWLDDAARADAIVVTKAMQAATIAEVFVEDGTIRVDLEIGTNDVQAFQNLLPPELLGPVAEETRPFVGAGWAVRIDDAEPLTGHIVTAERNKRIERDEITGAPLPVQAKDAEDVISLVLLYKFESEPESLSIRPPMREGGRFAAVDLGFVIYDRGIPVNDFRYLGQEETMDFDWEDPWFSRFRNPNLVRRYNAPLSAFLYVEHFEVRQEIIVRPRDLQQWVDLGLDGKCVVKVAEQDVLKQRVAAFLQERNPVTIDGRSVERRLDRINFIRRSLRQTGVVDPPEDLDLASATLGVIFVCPIDELPQTVEMTWELFGPKIQQIPGVATDEAGGLPATITADDPVLRWQNYLTNPNVPAIVAITTPPLRPVISFSVAGFSCALIALGMISWNAVRNASGKPRLRPATIAAIIAVIVAVLTWPYTRTSLPRPFTNPPSLSAEESSAVLAGLLHNVYRAFDRRDESLVYDRLARSITGDLLTDVYIQARKSMELENQGGARVAVTEVALLDAEMEERLDDGGFICRCRWNVSGSVGHWGHTHQRTNQYAARLTVKPIDETWKITQLELLDEQRIDADAGGTGS